MKVYRNAETGNLERIDEEDTLAVAALESLGYSEVTLADIKEKAKARAQAIKEARATVPPPPPAEPVETAAVPVAPAVPKK